MKINQMGILAAVFIIISAFMIPTDKNNTLSVFNKKVKANSWRIVNDVVMGGASSSSFKINNAGHGLFEGKVSTANNGGFASVRHKSLVKIENSKTIKIRLKGDGKDYQFRIKKESSDFESYITSFSTSGEWQTIEINLNDLYPSFRGRKLNKPNFNDSSFEEMSFMIANKKNEAFQLLLDKIEFK